MNFVAGKIGLTIRFNWKNTDTGWFSAADDLARTEWDNDNVDGESADEKILRIGNKPPNITIQ